MPATTTRARTSVSVVHDPTIQGDLTAARLLRMFDYVRRDLSRHVTREEGSGAGYDRIRIDWSAIADVRPGEVVTVTAMLGSVRARGHQVDYLATASNNRGRFALLAQAHGWTLVSVTGQGTPLNSQCLQRRSTNDRPA